MRRGVEGVREEGEWEGVREGEWEGVSEEASGRVCRGGVRGCEEGVVGCEGSGRVRRGSGRVGCEAL